jgi:prefoldin subunit 5
MVRVNLKANHSWGKLRAGLNAVGSLTHIRSDISVDAEAKVDPVIEAIRSLTEEVKQISSTQAGMQAQIKELTERMGGA